MLWNALKVNRHQYISVLTAMIFVNKSWKKVALSTILNCFKKSGFTINIQETENNQLNFKPIQWNSLPTQENVSFTDYVNVNEDFAVWGELYDAEILENTLSVDEKMKTTQILYLL